MVVKSYEVNECPNVGNDDDNSVKSAKMQNTDQMKRIDRYMLHITNEMVSDKSENRKKIRSNNANSGTKEDSLRHTH